MSSTTGHGSTLGGGMLLLQEVVALGRHVFNHRH